MGKNTSIYLGEHFQQFVEEQVYSGRYASASDVVRSALRMMEHQVEQREALRKAIDKGEESGLAEEFDLDNFKKSMQDKYTENG